MRRADGGPSWGIRSETPEQPNFVLWLRWRTWDAPPCPEAAWWAWLDEVLGVRPAPLHEQATLTRYPALAALAEREWPAFRRQWDASAGSQEALDRRATEAEIQARLDAVMAGSVLELNFLWVDHAGELYRRVGRHTWLLGEAYLDPPRLAELVARLRRDLEG